MDQDQSSKASLVASMLGKLAKGIPKRLTDAERDRRRSVMNQLNAQRAIRLKNRKLRRQGLLPSV